MKALIVDDDRFSLRIFKAMSEKIGLEAVTFSDPRAACDYSREHAIDIALVDFVMKEMNGLQVIKHLRLYNHDIPIIMITGDTENNELKVQALEEGATEFLTKPVEEPDFMARFKNLLDLRHAQILLNDKTKLLEEEVRKATHEIRIRENDTLRMLGMMAELKDPETGNHISRVAHYSQILAKSIDTNLYLSDLLFYASPLHDVGKMGTGDRILLKPDKLTEDEFNIMKRHTLNGYRMLTNSNSKSKYIKAGATIALTHHERFDGTGYPYARKGDNTHLFGRIVAISDVFDALTSKRPYKEAWSFDDSVDYIIEQSGKQFDPKLVKKFTQNLGEIRDIYAQLKA